MAEVRQERFIEIDWRGRVVAIEYAWIGDAQGRDPDRPLIVLLHEGLGSLSMWRDFPRTLCKATNARGLVFSRPGYGSSTPRVRSERWDVDYLHRQAYEVLPAFLEGVGVDASHPPWLLGHSDGGSIALLYAARFPRAVAGLIVLAPHVFVEPVSVTSIDDARRAYLETDLRARLGKHHDDVDGTFWGWNDIWLDPRFLDWNIEREIDRIECPILAIQGRDDEYGTLEQLYAIKRRVGTTQILALDDCRHSPHRDQPDRLVDAIVHFMQPALAGTQR